MKHLVRTFVGIRCGRQARTRLLRAAGALAAGDPALRLPAVEDLHITLQYLGNTPQEDLAEIGTALVDAAAECPPFEVEYVGLGAFPSVERPRVVWAAVREPDGAGRLAALAKAVGRALRPVGYRPEKRAFHAHVTLARVHRRPSERVLRTLAGADALKMDLGGDMLSDLKLILSDPGNHPYHYIDLTTIPLEGRGDTGAR